MHFQQCGQQNNLKIIPSQNSKISKMKNKHSRHPSQHMCELPSKKKKKKKKNPVSIVSEASKYKPTLRKAGCRVFL